MSFIPGSWFGKIILTRAGLAKTTRSARQVNELGEWNESDLPELLSLDTSSQDKFPSF